MIEQKASDAENVLRIRLAILDKAIDCIKHQAAYSRLHQDADRDGEEVIKLAILFEKYIYGKPQENESNRRF